MKITTYSQDGSIINEELVKVDIPDYLKVFNEDYPILNLTKDEYKLVDSRKESFAKTLLMDRLKFILRCDYGLYRESMEHCCRINVISSLLSDIRETEDLLASEGIKPRPWFKKVQDAIGKVDEMCKGTEEHRDDDNYAFTITIDMLTLFEAISEYAKKMYNYINDKGGSDRFPFDAVRTIESVYSQRRWLDLFKKGFFKVDEQNLTIDCSEFSDRLIKELLGSKGIDRASVYALMYEIESVAQRPIDMVRPSLDHVHRFSSVVIPQSTATYTINLNNEYGQGYQLNLDQGELNAITKDENAKILSIIQGYLKTIDENYKENKKESWTGDTNSLYDDFRYRHPEENGNWSVFEKDFRSRLLNQQPVSSYNPQECYEKLVAKKNSPNHLMDFSSELISDLLVILLNESNNKASQVGLYQTIFQFNYIKGMAGNTHSSPNTAITNALKLIEPILDDERIANLEDYIRDEIESVIKGIFNLECIRKNISKPYPNSKKFKGNFNLFLVLNIIDVLRGYGFIRNYTRSKVIEKISQCSPFIVDGGSNDWRKSTDSQLRKPDKAEIDGFIKKWKEHRFDKKK